MRRASRESEIDRPTVRKMAKSAVPVGYQLSGPRRKPKLGIFPSKIDEVLADEVSALRMSSALINLMGKYCRLINDPRQILRAPAENEQRIR